MQETKIILSIPGESFITNTINALLIVQAPSILYKDKLYHIDRYVPYIREDLGTIPHICVYFKDDEEDY